jgi:DNA-binding CsgD family transcriptional regulator
MLSVKEERQVANLKRQLDAAVLDASQWKNVCDALAATVGGAGTVLIPLDVRRRGLWMVHSDAIGGSVEAYAREGWYMNDLRFAAWPIMRRRGYAIDQDFADEDVMSRHPYYADFLARDGLGTFIGIDIPTGDGDWVASIQRPISAGNPSRTMLETVPRIRAMFVGAARAAQAIAASGIENWRLHFDSADRGFAMIGHNGRVGEMNAAAARLLMPFTRTRGEILLHDEAATRRLAELTARACARFPQTPLPPPVMLQVAPATALLFEVTPLPPGLRHFHLDAAAMLIVRLAETPSIDTRTALIRKFGLTLAEARLAERIGSGQLLRDAADAEGVTFETARSRLKSIFAKTDTNRQAELALVVARLAR